MRVETKSLGVGRSITHVNTRSNLMMRFRDSLAFIAEIAAIMIVGGVTGGAIEWVLVRWFGIEIPPVEGSLISLGACAWMISDIRRYQQNAQDQSDHEPGSTERFP
jgi:L-lactate permease